MPHGRKTERVVVVRTDTNGNVLDYDVVEQPSQSGLEEKSLSSRQTPRFKKNKTPNGESERVEKRSLKNEDSLPAVRNPSRKKRRRSGRRTPRQRRDSTSQTPRRRRDSMPQTSSRTQNTTPRSPGRSQESTSRSPGRTQDSSPRTPRRRRVRYVPPKSNVQIFEDRVLNWNADPKVDTQNEDAVRRLHIGVQKKIYREKLDWRGKSTLDNHNEELVERMKSGMKPVIYGAKVSWPATSRIDDQNEEYLEHKRRNPHVPDKIFSQSYQQEQKLKQDQYISNSDYFDQASSRLPPIDGEKRHRSRKPHVDQKQDDYIERMRQKRPEQKIFREKLKWRETHTPRIDNQNEEYLEAIRRDKFRPKIFSELPRWKSQSKIDTYNDMYDPSSYMKAPPIMREKLHWHARTKIDTGLEPESDDYDDSEDDYDEDDYYEDNEYDYESAT